MSDAPQPGSNPAPAAPSQSAAPRNFLSSDVEIKGSLSFNSDMVFDGKMTGEITSPASLTLGSNAFVDGEILTRTVVIRGVVHGNVTVEERCELRGEAQLIGDLKASRLIMEENASLVGKSEVTPPGKTISTAASTFSKPVDFLKRAIGS